MLRRLLGIVLLTQLAGCAYLASVSGNLEQHVDDWVAEQKYGLALDALSYVKPDAPDYRRLQAKRQAIELKAHTYEQNMVAKANRQAAEGKWEGALQTIETAQANLPDSEYLSNGKQKLLKLQTSRLDELDVDLLVARGDSLLRLLPVYANVAKVDSRNSRATQRLTTAKHEASEIAAELTRRGTLALDQKDLPLARRTLPLALKLDPTTATKQGNQRLLLLMGPTPAKDVSKRNRDDEVNELLQRYTQAVKERNWPEAQRLLALLELQPSPPPELPQLRSDLNDDVADAVHRYIEHGSVLYSRGKYEEALVVWRRAEVIDPDNERVRAHIARAERVLEKLHSLQEKQGAE